MELRSTAIAPRDDGRNISTIDGACHEIGRISAPQGIGMNEITVAAGCEAVGERMRSRNEIKLVPSHMRQAQPLRRGLIHGGDFTLYPPKTGGPTVFQSPLRHQLHADTNAEKRRSRGCGLFQRKTQTGAQPLGTVSESSLPRKNDTVCGANHLGVRADDDVLLKLHIRHGAACGLGSRCQISAIVIDDDDRSSAGKGGRETHRTPFVEGIMLPARGSADTAMRKARAKALKPLSAM